MPTPRALRNLAVDALRKSFVSRRLRLVLGAGVSLPFGIPDWPSFLRLIVEEMHSDPDVRSYLDNSNTNPLILARYIRSQTGGSGDFNELLHKILYRTFTDQPADSTFRAIVKFLEKSITHRQRTKIITYNFDCTLERFLETYAIGLPFASTDFASARNDYSIEIFHCHGRLPMEIGEAAAAKLVFDESEYHTVYYDQYNRSNVNQVSAFTEKTCLFIGCSLSDPNTRRLLDYSVKNKPDDELHYIFRQLPAGAGSLSRPVLREIMDIYEADARSLGCAIIWIRNFTEIGSLLTDISAS